MKRVLFVILIIAIVSAWGCKDDTGTTRITLRPPTIQSISPNEVSKAEHIVASLKGANLTGATQVTLGGGFTIEGFNVVSSTEIEIRFIVNTNAEAGPRDVTVTTSGGTTTASNLLTVLDNRAPRVTIDVLPTRGAINTTYNFDGLRSNDPDGSVVAFDWDFGDGKVASGPLVSHRFRAVGTHVVTLTVKDNKDAEGTGTVSIEVEDGVAPEAKFTISPKEGDVNTVFTFNASNSIDSDGSVVQYLWRFGDGQTATGNIVERDFPSGLASISLTVTDNKGLQDVLTKELQIGEFDQAKATSEIRAVVYEFFRRYSQLDTLTPEQIVVHWSSEPGCPGRDHEIHIIEQQQTFITKTTATVTGIIEVTFVNSKKAHAIAGADFVWTETDGSEHSGHATHDFEMVIEDGHWMICDFVLVKTSSSMQRIMQ